MSYLKVEFKVVPVKDIKHLNISFPIPDVSQHYESKVGKYSVIFRKFYLIKGPYCECKIITSLISSVWCGMSKLMVLIMINLFPAVCDSPPIVTTLLLHFLHSQ